nr:hypothetical protein [Tanacetum cinerariifolium]
ANSTGFAPVTQETLMNVSDLDSQSYAKPRPIREQDIAQSFRITPVVEDLDSEKSTSFTSMVGSPERRGGSYSTTRKVAMGSQLRLTFKQEAKLLKKAVAQVARWDQRIKAKEKQIKNLEALLEAEAEIKQVSTFQAQISGEERIKAAFKEFKKYEDDWVTSWCAEIDARLDALSIDFDEEVVDVSEVSDGLLEALDGSGDTIQLENVVSTISQEYLLEVTSEYGISKSLHPELLGLEDPIVEFPKGKVGVYTKFFEFANFRWMSFSKRPRKNTPQYYTKPLDSLKNWNNWFFWVDDKVFPTIVDWRINFLKDKMPYVDSYFAVAIATLNTRRTLIQKQLEALLCLVGLSQNYFLGDDVYPTFLYDDDRDMDLFNLISSPNLTKVKTGTRPRAAHEVPLLIATASRVIDMGDTAVASGSSGTPAAIGKSPLDFFDEDAPPEAAAMGPVVNKMHRKRGNEGAEANAPPNVLRKDHVASRPSQSTLGEVPGFYLEVRNPKDAWSFKDETLLEDAIVANISRAEKKKKCRVVCRTHGVDFAHHFRSNGIHVSVPTVASQGLAILLRMKLHRQIELRMRHLRGCSDLMSDILRGSLSYMPNVLGIRKVRTQNP